MEENNCLVKIPIAGKICAYALDPAEVWKGYNTSKPYAAFVTKTLVNSEGVIKRRLQACFGKLRAGVKASQGVSGVCVPLTGCNDPNTWQRWVVNKVSHPPVKPPLQLTFLNIKTVSDRPPSFRRCTH